MEIAEACQEQHNAYMRAIGREDLVVEWNDMDMENKLATERVVRFVIEGKDPDNTIVLKPPSSLTNAPGVMKVSWSLFKQMATYLGSLN